MRRPGWKHDRIVTCASERIPTRFQPEQSCERQPVLFEVVEEFACHVTQIQCRRSGTPHSMGSQRDLMIKVNIGILVAFVTGETRAYERFGELGNFRHMNWTVI